MTVTVNSERYVSMLQNFLQPRMEEIVEAEGLGDVWFQQDGATAHTARISLNVLRRMFPGRLVSLRDDLGWPARSPDLSSCDFFLWGYLKEKVFKRRPHTLPQLREQIIEEVNAICVNMLYETSEIDSNSVLLLTATILLTLFSEHKDYKWYVLLTSSIINFLLYIPPLLFYNSSKLLNWFCPTLYKVPMPLSTHARPRETRYWLLSR